ncbi:MAG: hypothetical protein ABEJ23_04310 [Haloarculaceae archaeon]
MRYGTDVDGGRVYVQTPDGDLLVGRVGAVLALVGGPAWTIEYSEWHRSRPDFDTDDEGVTVDVVDAIAALEFDRSFVEALAALPAEPRGDDAVSPRLGLFVGRLMGSLQTGLE